MISFQQELSAAGLSLVFTEKNLVDHVWQDHCRPDPPNEGVMVLDVSFTGFSVATSDLKQKSVLHLICATLGCGVYFFQ